LIAAFIPLLIAAVLRATVTVAAIERATVLANSGDTNLANGTKRFIVASRSLTRRLRLALIARLVASPYVALVTGRRTIRSAARHTGPATAGVTVGAELPVLAPITVCRHRVVDASIGALVAAVSCALVAVTAIPRCARANARLTLVVGGTEETVVTRSRSAIGIGAVDQ
jgi:hypothetical protein